jgi:hypothetical protein
MSGGASAAVARAAARTANAGAAGPAWRVVARAEAPASPPVYDVYRGPRRVVWGLRDRAAALRWVARLGGSPAAAAAGEAGVPRRRPWWAEHD